MPLEPCMECGETAVAERIVPFVVERGGKTATIMDRLMVCGSCGFDVYRGDQATEHERAVADAVRKLDGLLSPDDLRAFRERSGRGPEGMDEMLSLRRGPGRGGSAAASRTIPPRTHTFGAMQPAASDRVTAKAPRTAPGPSVPPQAHRTVVSLCASGLNGSKGARIIRRREPPALMSSMPVTSGGLLWGCIRKAGRPPRRDTVKTLCEVTNQPPWPSSALTASSRCRFRRLPLAPPRCARPRRGSRPRGAPRSDRDA